MPFQSSFDKYDKREILLPEDDEQYQKELKCNHIYRGFIRLNGQPETLVRFLFCPLCGKDIQKENCI